MTHWLSIAIVSTPLMVGGCLMMLVSGFLATNRRCFWWGVPLLAATTAYIFDQSIIVKLSWVISEKREAFWNVVRCGLSPVGAD
jgi:hypothetical protein